MKKLLLLAIGLLLTVLTFAQEEESEKYPLNWFVRFSPSVFAINSNPATMELFFLDDDSVVPDSAFASLETDNMWSYGLNVEISYLMNHDFTISHNAFFGFGSKGMFTYYSHLNLGREFAFGKLFVQPRIGLSYIYSSLELGDFYSENKDYFEINDRFIYDGMAVQLKSRTFAVTPSILIEYPIKEYVAVFAQVGGHYSFGRRSYLTFRGETDEVDEEGDYIIANENRDFDNQNVDFWVNGQQLFSRQSPYLPYNFNSIFVQLGLTIRLVETYSEE